MKIYYKHFIINNFFFKFFFIFSDGHHVWETEANVDKDSRKSVSRYEPHLQQYASFSSIIIHLDEGIFLYLRHSFLKISFSDIIMMTQGLAVHTFPASGL